jgi:hypothetical protein
MRLWLRCEQACPQVPGLFAKGKAAPYFSLQDKQTRRARRYHGNVSGYSGTESGGTNLLKGTDMKNYCRAGREEALRIRRGVA